MAGGRGGLGWIILAAALAVPGFLFYNWWSHLKTEHDHSVSQNARKRVEGGVFETPPASGRLINPMASTAPAAAQRPPLVPVAAAAAPPPAPPAAAAAPSSPVALDVSSMTTVVLPRDPMMSPLDLVRIQEAQMEAEEQRRRLEEERERKNAPPRRAVKRILKPIETQIELQGIVAKPDGVNLAIIDGSTVNPGDHFSVEGYPGVVSILKISSSEVTMQYQGRKFRMSVNAE